MADRLRVRVKSDEELGGMVMWEEIEANHVNVGAAGVLIFTWRKQEAGMIQGAGGVALPGMVVEERIVLVAQAEHGVLIPMVQPVEAANVVELAQR